MEDDGERDLRIVVVGPCASGKSTLVGNLCSSGYNIRACAQEHSYVPQLWKGFSKADILIFLDAELSTIAQRQNCAGWTQARLDKQRLRLAHARTHCDFCLQTDNLSREQVAERVEGFLRARGVTPKTRAESHD